MFKRALLVTLGLTAIGGTALACNEYNKPKVEKIVSTKTRIRKSSSPARWKPQVSRKPRPTSTAKRLRPRLRQFRPQW
jgi:hypothetical protein